MVRLVWLSLGTALVGIATATDALGQAARTITGTVRDSAGRALRGAVVVLDPGAASRSAVVDERGRFQFDRIDRGRHALRTSWVGYEPDDRTIDVPESGISVEIILSPLPFRLDTLTIVARRTGVFGTVATRPELRQLGNANLTVLATRFRTRTGNDGRFGSGSSPRVRT